MSRKIPVCVECRHGASYHAGGSYRPEAKVCGAAWAGHDDNGILGWRRCTCTRTKDEVLARISQPKRKAVA